MYKNVKCEKTIMGQLHYGDDLIEAMLVVCKEEGITAGCFELMGAVSRVKLAYYDQVEKKYDTCFESETGCEITSCMGKISLKDNTIFVHGHMTVSDKNGKVHGGHAMPGTIIFAAEFVVYKFGDAVFERVFDEVTHLNIWKLHKEK
jgi:uncharacterized protein